MNLDTLKNLSPKQMAWIVGLVVIFVLGYFENQKNSNMMGQTYNEGGNYSPGFSPGTTPGYGPGNNPGGNPYNNPGNSPYANPAYNNPAYPAQPGQASTGNCPPGTMSTQAAPGTFVCVPTGGAPGYGPNPAYGPNSSPGYANPANAQPNNGPWASGGNNQSDVWIDNPRNADAMTEAGDKATTNNVVVTVPDQE